MKPETSLLTSGWCEVLCRKIEASSESVTLTAMSCLPPARPNISDFSRLFAVAAAAAARGVRVEFILPTAQPQHPATLRNLASARYLHDQGISLHLVKPPRLLHAKTALIDSRLAFVGSGNLTPAASAQNFEAFILTSDASVCMALGRFHAELKRF